MAKSELIRFRCTESEKKAIESLALGSGVSLTEYILSRLLVATTSPDQPQKEIVATNETQKKNVATKPKTEGIFVTKAGKEIPLIRKPKKGIYSAERRQSVKGSNKVDLSSLM